MGMNLDVIKDDTRRLIESDEHLMRACTCNSEVMSCTESYSDDCGTYWANADECFGVLIARSLNGPTLGR